MTPGGLIPCPSVASLNDDFCVGPATGASSGQRPGPTPTDLPARLRRRLFWYFAAALLALAMGVGAATIVPLLGRLTRSEEAGLSHVAETRALAVGEWFRRAGGLARQITSRTQIRDLMEGVAQGRVTREHFAAFAGERLMDAMRLSPDMAGITRLGPNGEPLAACGVAIPREVWAIPPQGSDELALSAPVLLSGRLCVVIGAPIPGSRGGRAGTDLVAVDTVALGEKIMSPWPGTAPAACSSAGRTGTACRPFWPGRAKARRRDQAFPSGTPGPRPWRVATLRHPLHAGRGRGLHARGRRRLGGSS